MSLKKNNISKIEKALKKEKIVALVAPSFTSNFDYPSIISQLKKLGFDKVVVLTFGAKMVNKEYYELIKKSKVLIISSACPGIVETIKNRNPKYSKNIAKIYSPMIATGKICKKIYSGYKTCFISPCEMKKIEAEGSKFIDYVIDYDQLQKLFGDNGIRKIKEKIFFDKFYNDYTKVYPLSGGLSKSAHLKGILKPGEEKIIDGISDVMKFLESPDPKVRFLDVTFCKGGCIGGSHTSKIPLSEKKKRLKKYLEIASREKIPLGREGIVEKAKGIKFSA